MKKSTKPVGRKSDKEGEGFSDARGYIPEIGPIPTHNGLNTNNEPRGMKEREMAKKERQKPQ